MFYVTVERIINRSIICGITKSMYNDEEQGGGGYSAEGRCYSCCYLHTHQTRVTKHELNTISHPDNSINGIPSCTTRDTRQIGKLQAWNACKHVQYCTGSAGSVVDKSGGSERGM